MLEFFKYSKEQLLTLPHFWRTVWRIRLRFLPYNPSAEEVGGLVYETARTMNSFQIFKVKIVNQKPTAVDVLFKANPMLLLSGLPNLAGWYL
jgi:hypothetical protein